MQIKSILAIASIIALGACQLSDTERGLMGAAGGAGIAQATGVDPVTGAVIGGTAGVLCDNVGAC